MSDVVIDIKNLQKCYRLGEYTLKTLTSDISRWWARKNNREDPNLIIGQEEIKGTEFWALKGINANIKKGEAVGVIGRNGSGKSTLLKILARITAPTKGEVVLRGKVASMLEVGTGFHPEMTGRENIFLNGAILGMSTGEINSKLDDIIQFSECSDFIDTPVKRYSSGMYVKLAFAVAAHLDSDILLMDEVLAVGDMNFQKKCLDKMSSIVHDENRTVIFVSHNIESVKSLCSRSILLDRGKLIFDGETDEAATLYAAK